MKKSCTLTKIAMVVVLFLLVTSTTVYAQENGEENGEDDYEYDYEEENEPEHERDESGTVWIQTDVVTVMLDPQQPAYQYWYSADENGSLARFRVAYPMVIEFEDTNGDGAYQVNETIAFVPLQAFEWTLQTGSVTNEEGLNEEVYASYTKGGISGEDWDDDWYEDWMPETEENETDDDDDEDDEQEPFALTDEDSDDDELNLTKYEDMTVQFYAHIYLNDYNGSVTDDAGVQANYTVSAGTELKIDIEIGNFPFISNTSKVTVLNFLQEDIAASEDSDHKFITNEDDGEHEYESEDEWESDELGEAFDDVDEDDDGEDDDVQNISLVEGSTNITRAFYSWLDKAVIDLPNSTTNAVDVKASYFTTGEALLLFLAYPNFDDGSLVHDPSMKLLPESSPTQQPVGGLADISPEVAVGVLAIGIIAVAALVIRKR
ncbi:MAG: hypothetical protein GF309_07135 [Candidatus Lokiarchaeota archaeon]|nr:hypothetical protein [Candidatus Lokiarchaeota archaeon]